MTATAFLALVTLIGSVLLLAARPAAAAACDPPMFVDPAGGAFAGDAIEITGSGFEVLSTVNVFLDGIHLGTEQTALDLSWTLITVVPDLPPGTYILSYVVSPMFSPDFSCDLMEYVVNGIFLVPLTVVPLVPSTFGFVPLTILPFDPDPDPTTTPTTEAATVTTATTAAPTTVAESGTTSVADTTSSTPEDVESTTTSIEDSTGTSLIAGAVDSGGGVGGTLIGVLIGLGAAALLGGVWFLGRRTATVGGPPPPPPAPFDGGDG